VAGGLSHSFRLSNGQDQYGHKIVPEVVDVDADGIDPDLPGALFDCLSRPVRLNQLCFFPCALIMSSEEGEGGERLSCCIVFPRS
jgi:hypothetical protein